MDTNLEELQTLYIGGQASREHNGVVFRGEIVGFEVRGGDAVWVQCNPCIDNESGEWCLGTGEGFSFKPSSNTSAEVGAGDYVNRWGDRVTLRRHGHADAVDLRSLVGALIEINAAFAQPGNYKAGTRYDGYTLTVTWAQPVDGDGTPLGKRVSVWYGASYPVGISNAHELSINLITRHEDATVTARVYLKLDHGGMTTRGRCHVGRGATVWEAVATALRTPPE